MASADNLQQLAYVKITHYEVGPGGVPDKSDEMDSLKSCKFNFNLSSQKSPFEKDDSVLVEWRDDWYKATVTKIYGKSVGKQKFRIHYDGWDDKWDEVVSYDRIVHLAKCQDLDDDSNAWLLIFVEEGDDGEISKVGAISSPKAKSFNMETSNKSQVECLKVASDKNNAMDDKDKETKWWTCEPKGHISDGVDNNDI